MKRYAIALATLVALANCGADGEPVQPNLNATVSVTPSGVNSAAGIDLRKGPLTLNLGIF